MKDSLDLVRRQGVNVRSGVHPQSVVKGVVGPCDDCPRGKLPFKDRTRHTICRVVNLQRSARQVQG